MEILFWISGFALLYTYVGYPLLLRYWPKSEVLKDEQINHPAYEPAISIVIPVYNEGAIIREKIENTLSLDYPKDKKEILLVSDGSTDHTHEISQEYEKEGVKLIQQLIRRGKAGALNLGIQLAKNEIVIFSDASIMLEKDAVRMIVRKFRNLGIGCISGEDHMPGGSEEGAYGEYELALRNLESRVGSIVGASGCFYAQRRFLCKPFKEGMAPDFFSVLETVAEGYRAVTEPEAIGVMKTVKEQKGEFHRKVRTYLRGITTLFDFKHLLNPCRYGMFSLQLISHKLLRWLSWLFLVLLFLSNIILIDTAFYLSIFIIQTTFYAFAVIGWLVSSKPMIFRLPFFFSMVNLSAMVAWSKYIMGFRQEIWEPSRR